MAPVRAAAVLVHARPDVEIRRHGVDGLSAMGLEDEHAAATFGRSSFEPVQALLGEIDIGEGHRTTGQEIDGDRRGPGSMLCDGHAAF